ncbi:hypothetical protein [Phenylobacterium sp.]|uniref:hypothetical protein n=1 Tax=Phenylobacterium sp. TaxID=1871053 RepID=UPI00260008C3|nr:hypothetical protein [Phenylobacterium sp.]
MSVLEEVLADAQPGYEDSVATILARFDAHLDGVYDGAEADEFVARTIVGLERPDLDAGVRLQLISDLSALAWWCGIDLGPQGAGALSALARRTYYEAAQAVRVRIDRADPAAKTAHAVFVGPLVNRLHSPTRGAFDYVRALARDPANRRVDVYYSGELTDDLRIYGGERLGADAGKARFISMTANPDFLADVVGDGFCTFHVWCEQAYAIHISLMSLLGPTVMFTCGDAAPAQFADVYWYCHEADYIRALWAGQGAPESFGKRYRQTESAAFNRVAPLRTRTRAELGWGAGEVVIVTAGNRLGIDMDQVFVDGLAGFVMRHERVRWVVVGRLQDFFIGAFEQVLGERFTHVAFDPDLASLLALTDIFANPFRAGGGNTAVMAIDAGAVVLTRGDLGDVGAFVPPAHRAGDADAYFAMLEALVADPALRAAQAAEQRAVLARRLDQDLFAEELKALSALAYERFAKRTPVSLEQVFAQAPTRRQTLKGSGRRARLR